MLDSTTIQPSGDGLPGKLQRLSGREREVLDLVATGLTNDQVARKLCLSVHAVKFHLSHIYRKLAVGNRTEAVFILLTQPPGEN